jgi:integrase
MNKRRRRGDGSVTERKDGRYEAALYVHTPNGIKKRKRRYTSSRSEAEAALVELRKLDSNGLMTDTRQQKVGDYLDYWLSICRTSIRPSTYQSYEAIVRLYLKPGLGNKLLVNLRVSDVQTHFDEQLRSGTSIRTVQKQRIILSTALKRAEQEELLIRNVASVTKIPPYHSKEIIPWSKAQVQQFLAFAKDDPFYPLFVILALYGLRISEALGLRWQNVDIDNEVIHVRQQLLYNDNAFEYAELKTSAAKRDLPIQPIVRESLININRTNDGPLPDLIFKSINGNPVDKRGLLRRFKQLSKEAGVPVITLHTIRHTAATMLKDMGTPKDIQELLGHANIATTLQIYTHSGLPQLDLILSRYAQQLAEISPSSRQV